ncbi:PhzF family phenazine biosynthesis protein [Paenibacillus amylolyticus]|uniref:PhzF family phenazine biosynthesis protein n=1 Tax=Paenibacillus amylolyticus TaxID=1451 RepID=UPI003D97572E
MTAKSDKFDFVSRSFFPKINVNEYPVWGSAYCNFIPYWAKRLTVRQLSKRGEILYCYVLVHSGNRYKFMSQAKDTNLYR